MAEFSADISLCTEKYFFKRKKYLYFIISFCLNNLQLDSTSMSHHNRKVEYK